MWLITDYTNARLVCVLREKLVTIERAKQRERERVRERERAKQPNTVCVALERLNRWQVKVSENQTRLRVTACHLFFTYCSVTMSIVTGAIEIKTESNRTFRLEARLMIDRWRSLFFWGGVNSGSEAALSERQKGENIIKTGPANR